jgi:hypothetical protein
LAAVLMLSFAFDCAAIFIDEANEQKNSKSIFKRIIK